MYPKKLGEAIVKGVIKQKAWDASNNVSILAMNWKQPSSFTASIGADIRKERINLNQGYCSSVIRDGDTNKPVGNAPRDWVVGVCEEDGGVDRRGV